MFGYYFNFVLVIESVDERRIQPPNKNGVTPSRKDMIHYKL